ncbi:MAG: hypothetical protein ACXWFQ_00975, partial [Thermoanaerobaculia bacterium]
LLLWPAALRASRAALPSSGRLALVLAPLSLLVLYAGYPNWHGGFSVGPRYLVAALPFLVFPFAFGKGGFLESALVGASTLAVCATTLAFPFVPPGFALPWGSFAAFFFERGLTAPNALHLLSPAAARFVLPAIVCVAVYFFLHGKREEKIFLEGKRGERDFLEGKKEGIRGTRRRFALAFFSGAAAYAALGLLLSKQIFSPPSNSSLLLQRAYIADVYFGQRGTLEEEIARTGISQPRLLARRERELALPPRPWPFTAASR